MTGRVPSEQKHMGVRRPDGTYRCLDCGGTFTGWPPSCPGKTAPARETTPDA